MGYNPPEAADGGHLRYRGWRHRKLGKMYPRSPPASRAIDIPTRGCGVPAQFFTAVFSPFFNWPDLILRLPAPLRGLAGRLPRGRSWRGGAHGRGLSAFWRGLPHPRQIPVRKYSKWLRSRIVQPISLDLHHVVRALRLYILRASGAPFMTQFPIKTIIHPTDFSEASRKAFAHAMAFSLAAKSRLYILHVAKDGENRDLYSQPHVRELLALWGKMNAKEPPEAIAARTGVQVLKVAMHPGDPRQRIDKFIASHECDLMVLATHHRTALMHLVSGSVAADVSNDSRVPTLFLRDDLKGFIDIRTGSSQLETLLIPIGPEVSASAIEHIEAIAKLVAPRICIKRLHVGTQQPVVVYRGDEHRSMQIEVRDGAVVETIVRVAAEIGAGLIAMPTEGRHGLSDALLGTTTERVLREASCPVLALPIPRNLFFASHPEEAAASKTVFPTDQPSGDLSSGVAQVIEDVEHRISEFALGLHLAHWHPISTAPCNQSLELRVAEGDDMVTVQFPCYLTNDNEWINADLGTQVKLNPVQWRIWRHSKPAHPHRSQM